MPVEAFKTVGERIDFMGRRDSLARVSSLPAGCLAVVSLGRGQDEKNAGSRSGSYALIMAWVRKLRLRKLVEPAGSDLTQGNPFWPF